MDDKIVTNFVNNSKSKKNVVKKNKYIYNNKNVENNTYKIYETENFKKLVSSTEQGFLPIKKEGVNQLFYWTAFSEYNVTQAPLVFWFNGGPGSTSMFGFFGGVGPCNLYKNDAGNLYLESNKYAYNKFVNLIALEQNLGVGYSYGEPILKVDELSDAVAYAIETLVKRYNKKYQHTFDVYLIGNSYFGIAGPFIFNKLLKRGIISKQCIGLGLGSPISDEKLIQEAYLNYIPNNGLGNPYTAKKAYDNKVDLLTWFLYSQDNFQTNFYDKTVCNYGNSDVNLIEFMNYKQVKKSLNVNINKTFISSNQTIFDKIERPVSSIPLLQEIWNNYNWTKILLWNGSNDIITPISHSWQIATSISSTFKDAPAYAWKPCSGTVKAGSYCNNGCCTDGTCVGQMWQDPEYKSSLALVCCKNSGHATQVGQPCGMQQLIKQWCIDGVFAAQELPTYTSLSGISANNIKMINNLALVNPPLANRKLKELVKLVKLVDNGKK
jgi:hypothetical protein